MSPRLPKARSQPSGFHLYLEGLINLPGSAGVWRTFSPLSAARSHPAVSVFEDKIYSFGGGGEGFKSLNLSEVYNPVLDQWSALAPMPTERSGASAVTLGDAIYVMGGGFKKADGKFKFLTTVEAYYPKEDRWQAMPSLIQPHDYPACAVLNDQIYIIGGHHPDATEGGPSTDPAFSFTERWDGSARPWRAVNPMPTPRFAASAVAIDGQLWVMGGVAATPKGFHEYDLIEVYDPETSKWRRSPLALPWLLAGQGAVVLNQSLYVFGGFREDSGIGKHGAVLNLADQSWSSLPPMPRDRAAMGVAVVNETIYLIGGWRADRSVKHTVIGFKNA